MADAILTQSGIYKITNTVNGKMYVGSAVLIKRRFGQHRSALQNNKHHSKRLQNAWNKYGSDAFSFAILECVADKTLLIAREQAWIDLLNSASADGYNATPKAGSRLGSKATQETIAKQSAAKKGKKQSPEAIANRAAAMRGKVCSEETKLKISAKAKGREISAAARAKMSLARKGIAGRPMSIQTREKISASQTGVPRKKHSAETRAKMSLAHIGKTYKKRRTAMLASAE